MLYLDVARSSLDPSRTTSRVGISAKYASQEFWEAPAAAVAICSLVHPGNRTGA